MKGIAVVISFLTWSVTMGQTYFKMEDNYKCSWTNYYPSANLASVQPVRAELINAIFDSISRRSAIEFNYPQGGCQQRAEIMSLILSKMYNIDHARIWLFSPQDLDPTRKERLFIYDKNGWSANDTIYWGYHVAPVVLVRQANGIDTLVLDPSLERMRPLHLNEWFARIGNSGISSYTFLQKDKYFFNNQPKAGGGYTSAIDGCFYEYVGAAVNNLVMEKGLAVNDLAVIIHDKYIRPMETSTSTDAAALAGLKAIFGNATVMDYLFAQNSSGATDATTLRYAFAHYQAIMVDARTIYDQRLAYWTGISDQLLGCLNCH